MASLYEINRAIMSCVDAETGEVIDPEALDALMIYKDDKIEGIALWIKNLVSDAAAFKAEKEAFAARQKAAENKAESLKKYLAYALDGQKFSTNRCAISFRKSEKIEISDDLLIPKEFIREKTTYEPDKTAIKEAIKAGNEVAGCRLVESFNTQIK